MTETTLGYPLRWVSTSPTRGCGRGVGEEHLLDGKGRSLAFTRPEARRPEVDGGVAGAVVAGLGWGGHGGSECDVSLYVPADGQGEGALRTDGEDAWSGTLSRRDRPSLRRSTFLVEGQLFGPDEQQVSIRAEFKRRSVREIIVDIGERSFLMHRCGVVHQARHVVDMGTGDHALMLIEIVRPRLPGMENLTGTQGLGAGRTHSLGARGRGAGVRGAGGRGAGGRGVGGRGAGGRGARVRRARPFVRAHQGGAEAIREGVPGSDAGALKIPAARDLAVYEIAVLCWVSAQVDMTWLDMRG